MEAAGRIFRYARTNPGNFAQLGLTHGVGLFIGQPGNQLGMAISPQDNGIGHINNGL
ncbi:hypothetical protein D3C81_1357140 [compost metagenome]